MATRDTKSKTQRALPPILEAAAMVGLLVLVNFVFFRSRPGFVELAPHPTLFIVLFVVARYGFTAGLWAMLIATIGHAATLIALVDVPSFYHLLAAPYATPVVVLVPTTVILGLIVQRHLERVERAAAREKKVADENRRLLEELAKLRDVNVDLAGKVVGADATFQRLYRYAKFLNVSDVHEIYGGLTLMLAEVLGAGMVSVWEPRGNEMKLVTRRGEDETVPPFKLDNLALAYFDAHGILALHDVPEANRYPGLPYLIGKINQGRGGQIAAYVTVEKIEFARYNAEAIRFFTLAVDWTSTSVGNAAQISKPAERGKSEARTASFSGRVQLEKLIAVAGKNASLSQTIYDAETLDPRRVSGPQPPRGAVTLGVLLEEVDKYLRGKEGSGG